MKPDRYLKYQRIFQTALSPNNLHCIQVPNRKVSRFDQ